MNKITAALLSTCFLFAAGSSLAQDAMAKDHMAKDSMKKDHMAKDSMKKDHMGKDSMKKDHMGKDEMTMKMEKMQMDQMEKGSSM